MLCSAEPPGCAAWYLAEKWVVFAQAPHAAPRGAPLGRTSLMALWLSPLHHLLVLSQTSTMYKDERRATPTGVPGETQAKEQQTSISKRRTQALDSRTYPWVPSATWTKFSIHPVTKQPLTVITKPYKEQQEGNTKENRACRLCLGSRSIIGEVQCCRGAARCHQCPKELAATASGANASGCIRPSWGCQRMARNTVGFPTTRVMAGSFAWNSPRFEVLQGIYQIQTIP